MVQNSDDPKDGGTLSFRVSKALRARFDAAAEVKSQRAGVKVKTSTVVAALAERGLEAFEQEHAGEAKQRRGGALPSNSEMTR